MARHRLDPVSLTFGLVAIAVGITALTRDLALWNITIDSAWVWPVMAIGAGLALLGTALVSRGKRDSRTEEDAGYPEDPPAS